MTKLDLIDLLLKKVAKKHISKVCNVIFKNMLINKQLLEDIEKIRIYAFKKSYLITMIDKHKISYKAFISFKGEN